MRGRGNADVICSGIGPNGGDIHIDVAIVHTLAKSYIDDARRTLGPEVPVPARLGPGADDNTTPGDIKKIEDKKHTKYDHKLPNPKGNDRLLAGVVDSFGGCRNGEFKCVFDTLASVAHDNTGTAKGSFLWYWTTRISIDVQKQLWGSLDRIFARALRKAGYFTDTDFEIITQHAAAQHAVGGP